MTASRYPLWCVDTGPDSGEEFRYHGPFDTEASAIAARDRHGDGTVRRCRRVLATEIDALEYEFSTLVESLNDTACCGGISSTSRGAWARWDEQMVHRRDGAAEAFREFADRWLRVDAYVCEGDEPKAIRERDEARRFAEHWRRRDGQIKRGADPTKVFDLLMEVLDEAIDASTVEEFLVEENGNAGLESDYDLFLRVAARVARDHRKSELRGQGHDRGAESPDRGADHVG